MSNIDAVARHSQPHEIHLVGMGLGHALTPAVHNFAAHSMNVPWRLIATECPTTSDCDRIFRSPNQAGGVVTMPWKSEIMKHLDRIDDTAKILRACNVVYSDENGKLCGSNTDWIGIEGALRAGDEDRAESMKVGIAAVIGAGGRRKGGHLCARLSIRGGRDLHSEPGRRRSGSARSGLQPDGLSTLAHQNPWSKRNH